MTLASSISAIPLQNPVTQLTPGPSPVSGTSSGASFGDIIDAINPLQHIPVLSGLFRAATGSQISGGAKIIGDTLYGGIFGLGSALSGLVSSVADVAVKQASGTDITEHVLGALGMGNSPTALAGNAVPLVPDPLGTLPGFPLAADSAAIATGQVNMALNAIYHSDPATVSSQYQRAQVLGALDKQLVKMAV